MLINVKMPTIVGILTFMSRIDFDQTRGQIYINIEDPLQSNEIFHKV